MRVNRIKEHLMNIDIENLDAMSQVEKEALCFRLLVERDKINERLKKVQDAMVVDEEI